MSVPIYRHWRELKLDRFLLSSPHRRLLILIFIFVPPLTSIQATTVYTDCHHDPTKQAARSKELHELFLADQKDRKDVAPADFQQRDRIRRMRVGEIFGEGCIKSAQDYLHAAIVFQHGDAPDHFYQTFLFSLRGSQLGDSKQLRNAALGLDRFLVKTQRKQLFGSQAFKENSGSCWCLEPLEKSFPDGERKKYMGATLKDQRTWIDNLNAGAACGPAEECKHSLADTPKGSIPGFW